MTQGYGVPKYSQKEIEEIRKKEVKQDSVQVDLTSQKLTEAAQEKADEEARINLITQK